MVAERLESCSAIGFQGHSMPSRGEVAVKIFGFEFPFQQTSSTIFIQISPSRCLWSETVSRKTSEHWSESLYERLAAQLVLYGRALGLSHAEAEDVLQETFLALLDKEELPLEAEHYCVRCYRNRALNYRRSLWRRLTRELESRRWFERSVHCDASEQAAMRCLKKLPIEQREVIVLKIWHRYTFEEIGDLLALSPNTAAGRYRYGLQKIRSCLEGVSYERDEFSGNDFAILETAPAVRQD